MTMPVLPIPRNGTCPSGYAPQGNMCVPRAGARPAIPKIGTCPPGWRPQGNYCLAMSDTPKTVIPKIGLCPAGYAPFGNYCVKI